MTDATKAERADNAFVGAFGLVRDYADEAPRYLAVRRDGHLDFVRAIRAEGSTYKESLEHALADQLGLRLRKDYIVSGVPRVHLNSRLCGSKCGLTEDEPRWYVCEFFIVSLYGRKWQEPIESNADLVWLTARDIARERGPDGTPLFPDLVELLKTGEAIPADEVR